jgi:hypothetical protein
LCSGRVFQMIHPQNTTVTITTHFAMPFLHILAPFVIHQPVRCVCMRWSSGRHNRGGWRTLPGINLKCSWNRQPAEKPPGLPDPAAGNRWPLPAAANVVRNPAITLPWQHNKKSDGLSHPLKTFPGSFARQKYRGIILLRD